jgi:hypothetical protein
LLKAFGYTILIILLFSCSGGNKVQNGRFIQKRKYTKGFYFSSKAKQRSESIQTAEQTAGEKPKFILKKPIQQPDKEISNPIKKETQLSQVVETDHSIKSDGKPVFLELKTNENTEITITSNETLNSQRKFSSKPYPWEVRNSIKIGLIVALSLLGFAILLPFGLLFFEGTGLHFLAFWFFVTMGIVNLFFFIALEFYWAIFIGILLFVLAFCIMIRGYFIQKPPGF